MHVVRVAILTTGVVAGFVGMYLVWWKTRGRRRMAYRDVDADRAVMTTLFIVGVCALLLELGWIR